MYFLGPSCHAFDKILCLPRWLDTMLAAPAYQASIDTLRHSITSRKILYTTFRFLSRPFEKIFSKNKKKLSIFLPFSMALGYYGRKYYFWHFSVQSFFTAFFLYQNAAASPRLHKTFTRETIDFTSNLCYNITDKSARRCNL